MGCSNSSNVDYPKPARSSKKLVNGATAQIKKKYNIATKVLGSGAFGKVFMGTSVNDDNFKVAIKVIPKRNIKDEIEALMDEISILRNLDHPNIIKYK